MLNSCKKGDQVENNSQPSKQEKNSQSRYDELLDMKKRSGDRKTAMVLHSSALAEHKNKNYVESEKLWYQAAKADPAWGRAYFNLACATARQGKKWISFDYLKIAIGLDPEISKKIKTDSDLVSIRKLPEYRFLLPGDAPDTAGHWSADLVGKEFFSSAGHSYTRTIILKKDGKAIINEDNTGGMDPPPESLGSWKLVAGNLEVIYINAVGLDVQGGQEMNNFKFTNKDEFLEEFNSETSGCGNETTVVNATFKTYRSDDKTFIFADKSDGSGLYIRDLDDFHPEPGDSLDNYVYFEQGDFKTKVDTANVGTEYMVTIKDLEVERPEYVYHCLKTATIQ